MINRATLMGRIGHKKSKTTKKGTNMTELSIATNRKYKDAQGTQNDVTTWHTVYFFNKIADIAEKYTEVGDLVYVEGEISNRKIGDGDDSRWIYSVNGSEIKLLPNKRENKPAPDDSRTNSRPVTDDTYGFDNDVPF